MLEFTDVINIELHVPDFKKAIDFYRILGFNVLWMSEDYLVMRKGNNILSFYMGNEKVYEQDYFKEFPKNTKRGYAVEIILFEKNIDKFYDEIKNKVDVVSELKTKRWRKKDFRIEDPFGFYIRFTEPYDRINDPEKIKNTSKFLNEIEDKKC